MHPGDSLAYHLLEMRLDFDAPTRFYRFPGFVLHSVLGRKLRQFACALKRRDCDACPLLNHCAYAFFFNTPNSSCPGVLPGRDKLPRPWLLQIGPAPDPDQPLKRLDLRLVLLGPAVNSAHLLLLALQEAGRDGVLTARVPFQVSEVRLNRETWSGSFSAEADPRVQGFCWQAEQAGEASAGKISLELLTPLRLKICGRYRDSFSAADLFGAAAERLRLLVNIYGRPKKAGEDGRPALPGGLVIEQKLRWVDFNRYSGRQRQAMKLGGVIGSIDLAGGFDRYALSLLQGVADLGLGKGTSFGLGQLELRERAPKLQNKNKEN